MAGVAKCYWSLWLVEAEPQPVCVRGGRLWLTCVSCLSACPDELEEVFLDELFTSFVPLMVEDFD